jgi:hypothetical protein
LLKVMFQCLGHSSDKENTSSGVSVTAGSRKHGSVAAALTGSNRALFTSLHIGRQVVGPQTARGYIEERDARGSGQWTSTENEKVVRDAQEPARNQPTPLDGTQFASDARGAT